MKIIIEYKLHRGQGGEFTHPAWLSDSGFFYNGKSYIGTIDHVNNDYYIPTGLVSLTEDTLIERVVAIQNNPALDTYVGSDSIPLGVQGISTMVSDLIHSWIETTGEEP